jgi:hydroxypyruvate isomerase
MDGAICNLEACGCDGNDMEARTKMVHDEFAIIATNVHEETIVVVLKLTTSNNVPTYPWHNVQSMVQLVSS